MEKFKPTIEIQNKYGVLDPEQFLETKNSHSCCCSGSGEKSSGCCGGGSHSSGGCCKEKKKFDLSELSEKQLEILDMLKSNFNLPIAEFILKSTKESDFESVCLSPVFIFDKNDDMDTVNETAKAINDLERKEFVVLNFEEQLCNCSYEEFEKSFVLSHFKQTVSLGKKYPNFLGDIAIIDKGYMALSYDYLITIDPNYETE